jgi:hypothetical protein
LKQQRLEQEKMGKTVYTVIAEEREIAEETVYDIMSRLIERKAKKFAEDIISNRIAERTCYLESNGGKKVY